MARNFPRFRDLPTELRLQIWSYCIPGPRVVEMDHPLTDRQLTFPASPPRELWSSPTGGVPLVSHVCREARSVALNRHQYVTNDVGQTDESGTPCPPYDSDFGFNPLVRFRKGFDIVHLNWHKGYVCHSMCNPPQYPWATFQWLANQAATASVSAGLLLPFEPTQQNPYNDTFGAEDLRYFNPNRLYYIVLAIVEIHISAGEAAQAGVFGFLGEEPIQLVDPRDTAKIVKYRDVWRRHQSGSPSDEERDVADFFSTAIDAADVYRVRVERWRQNLDKVWLWAKCVDLDMPWETRYEIWPNWRTAWEDQDYDSDGNQISYGCRKLNREHPWVETQLALMPRFEPAVMFRHCVGLCGRWVPTEGDGPWPGDNLLPGDPGGVFRHIATRLVT